MMHILSRATRPANETFAMFTPKFQRLENLPDMDRSVLEQPRVVQALTDIEADLGTQGRILVRPSGTEPLIRVMVEADSETLLEQNMREIILLLQDESRKSA